MASEGHNVSILMVKRKQYVSYTLVYIYQTTLRHVQENRNMKVVVY